MVEAIRLHTEVVGERPRGWYTGRTSMHTVRLAAEEGGFAYVADSYADDLPYWMRFGGRDQLIVPYTLDANDMRFATPQGFNSGYAVRGLPEGQFDVLYAEGLAGAPKMLSIGLHCRLVGRPGRAAALKRALDYMARMTASGSPRGWRSPSTGRRPIRQAAPRDRRRWTAKPSSRPSAASSSIRPGSPSAPSSWSLARPMTPRAACIRR
jgi:hypothetical protein